MTFCVGLRTNNSLVAISDTRLTSGEVDFVISSKKVFLFEDGNKHSMFIMTSGLKSISDMVITYLNERKEQLYACDKLYQGVDLVAKIIRELKILGRELSIGDKKSGSLQHRGYGKELIREAERICFEEFDKKRLFVLSGVGVKQYYRALGFSDDGVYLSKSVNF